MAMNIWGNVTGIFLVFAVRQMLGFGFMNSSGFMNEHVSAQS